MLTKLEDDQKHFSEDDKIFIYDIGFFSYFLFLEIQLVCVCVCVCVCVFSKFIEHLKVILEHSIPLFQSPSCCNNNHVLPCLVSLK